MSAELFEDPEQEKNNQYVKILETRVENLRAHFDSVQIVATRFNENGSTTLYDAGDGNWFARYGSLKDWVRKQERE